ncbi:uncharacterized protein LOC131941954 [Physella acuta]|uniref:uncharacterized protein LOC131941954 n=1 Tax=Physella acuta TaxID=109671 RepID=UPI0027DE21D2|nr:uncharacterized protein LOC131941954 [Physella acuta]
MVLSSKFLSLAIVVTSCLIAYISADSQSASEGGLSPAPQQQPLHSLLPPRSSYPSALSPRDAPASSASDADDFVSLASRGAPRFVGRSANDAIQKRSSEEVSSGILSDNHRLDKRSAPYFIGKKSLDEKRAYSARGAPFFIGKRSGYYLSPGRTSSSPYLSAQEFKETFRRTDPYFVGKRVLDETEDSDLFDKRGAPRFVGKRGPPRFVGKRGPPRFVGKRGAPRFVGKRGAPRFVGKRDENEFDDLYGVNDSFDQIDDADYMMSLREVVPYLRSLQDLQTTTEDAQEAEEDSRGTKVGRAAQKLGVLHKSWACCTKVGRAAQKLGVLHKRRSCGIKDDHAAQNLGKRHKRWASGTTCGHAAGKYTWQRCSTEIAAGDRHADEAENTSPVKRDLRSQGMSIEPSLDDEKGPFDVVEEPSFEEPTDKQDAALKGDGGFVSQGPESDAPGQLVAKRFTEFVGKRSGYSEANDEAEDERDVSSDRADSISKATYWNQLRRLLHTMDSIKRQYEFVGKRYDFLGKRYDFLGKRRPYDFIGKRYDFVGKRAPYDFLGKKSYDFLGKKSYDFLGKRYDFLGKRPAYEFDDGFGIVGHSPNAPSSAGDISAMKRYSEFLGKRSEELGPGVSERLAAILQNPELRKRLSQALSQRFKEHIPEFIGK